IRIHDQTPKSKKPRAPLGARGHMSISSRDLRGGLASVTSSGHLPRARRHRRDAAGGHLETDANRETREAHAVDRLGDHHTPNPEKVRGWLVTNTSRFVNLRF